MKKDEVPYAPEEEGEVVESVPDARVRVDVSDIAVEEGVSGVVESFESEVVVVGEDSLLEVIVDSLLLSFVVDDDDVGSGSIYIQ
jgi:hypothetical protein